MTTLTKRKALARPEKKAQKDARTEIYRALYGQQNWDKTRGTRVNDPILDDCRDGKDCTYASAKAIWDRLSGMAGFNPIQIIAFEDRIEALRRVKRRETQDND